MTVRVLWVTKGLGPGGAERLLVATAGSAALGDADVDVEAAYVLPWKDHLVADLETAGVRCRCLSTRRRDVLWPLRLTRLVRSGGYDIVHGHSPLPMAVARLAAVAGFGPRRGRDRPVLMSTEHNSWPTYRWPTRLVNRLTIRWDEQVWAVSDEVRESIRLPRRILRRRLPTTDVVTLRHGIDVAAVRANSVDRDAVRADLGLVGALVIGTVANFREQKDYPNLLRALRQLADRGVAFRAVIVGQGPDEAAVRALASELSLDDVVTFTGFRADATRVMAAFDVFVLASRWEGLPVAVMEAHALGLPIVATAVGGVAEALRPDTDALLVPPASPTALADALQRAATDMQLRGQLAAASAACAARYDVDAAATAQVERYLATSPHTAVGESAAPMRAPSVATTPAAESPARAVDTASRRDGASIEIRPAVAADRSAILALLSRSLGWADGDETFAAFFEWKHDLNPFGVSPAWVAIDRRASVSSAAANTDDGRLVGLRTFMRWEFERGGATVLAARAVDTATDPDYQGQGLFRRMTMTGLDALRAEGVQFVFNTPNDQSRPGYLKMGWREVGRVPAAVHPCGPLATARLRAARVPAAHWSERITIGETIGSWVDQHPQQRRLHAGGSVGAPHRGPGADVRQLRTRQTDPYLRWRFGFEPLCYRVVSSGGLGDAATIMVRLRRRGPVTELAVVAQLAGSTRDADRLARRTAAELGANHVLRLGASDVRHGFVGLPGGGPVLTWRAVNDPGQPPLANWALTLGDIELL